jgi:predicted  nucleic acid-binding Zn-ribbon protein
MSYFSKFYQVDVRDSIAKEFTNSKGEVDDMMAGLHEIRVRMAEKEFDLKELESKVKKNKPDLRPTRPKRS